MCDNSTIEDIKDSAEYVAGQDTGRRNVGGVRTMCTVTAVAAAAEEAGNNPNRRRIAVGGIWIVGKRGGVGG